MFKRIVACVSIVTLFGLGCYNTYEVPKGEFEKLQQATTADQTAVVKSDEGEGVEVTKDTSLFVRSKGGRRYAVTPFNFKMTPTQLVASDRDTLLALDEVDTYEVDHISVLKTTLLIVAGVGAAAGLIVYTVATAGEKSFGGN